MNANPGPRPPDLPGAYPVSDTELRALHAQLAARADLAGQHGQHVVVVFAGEGHPDQAGRGGGQQQRAYRAVDGPVSQVEQAGGVRARGELIMQCSQVGSTDRERTGQAWRLRGGTGGH